MNGTPRPQTVMSDNSSLVDDFLRRELRVGDPRNLASVLGALQRRYPAAVQRLEQESTGVPVQLSAAVQVPEVLTPAIATPSSREGQRVMDNLERDLQALLTHPANREVLPELRGWRTTLSREVSDGLAAAALAQDPATRDRAFTAVRQLEEFARVARLTATNRVELLYEYRRLATTIDAAAMAIRIGMGEALDAAGLSDGGLILPIAASEGRERKQGLIYALRRLAGGTDQDDWPDAAASFRQLRSRLQKRGRAELLPYLREDYLSVRLDNLLGEVERQDANALRELSASSSELSRLQELLSVVAESDGDPLPASEALSAFVENLRLFLELFGLGDAGRANRIGARLTELALPLPLAATSGDDIDRIGRRKLRILVTGRQEFALAVENHFEAAATGGDDDERDELEHADQALYHLDRAIDLMALGSEQDDDEEQLAAGHLGLAITLLAEVDVDDPPVPLASPSPANLAQIGRQAVRDFLGWRTLTRALTGDYLSGSLSGGEIPGFVTDLVNATLGDDGQSDELPPLRSISDLEVVARVTLPPMPAVDRYSFHRTADALERLANRPDRGSGSEFPPGTIVGGAPGGTASAADSRTALASGAESSDTSMMASATPGMLSEPVAAKLNALLASTEKTLVSLARGEWSQALITLQTLWQEIRPDVAPAAGPATLAFDELFSDYKSRSADQVQSVKSGQLATCRRIFKSIISNEATS